jgi:hypothetical protein
MFAVSSGSYRFLVKWTEGAESTSEVFVYFFVRNSCVCLSLVCCQSLAWALGECFPLGFCFSRRPWVVPVPYSNKEGSLIPLGLL